MDILKFFLYKTRMQSAPTFLESLHHRPEDEWIRTAHSVVRAGKISAGADYGISRDAHDGQDILYCLNGCGSVRSLGETIKITEGQLIWIANEQPHAHAADKNDPWTLLWFRLDGPNTPLLREKMFADSNQARVDMPDRMALEIWFDKLFHTMRGADIGLDFRLNLLVSEFLIAINLAIRGNLGGEIPPVLHTALSAMRGELAHLWTSADLSTITGLSGSQIRRLFRRHFRLSPHQWLLRERLNRAQTLMSDSPKPLAEIAELCGFCDVYHFNREFRRSIGLPPATWRRREVGHNQRA